MQNMFEIKDLVKTYKTKQHTVEALKGINLSLPDKGMVFILGKSGCGKTSFLNVLGGLDSFDGGEVAFNGKPLSGFSEAELDEYRNSTVGFIFQENNLINNLTVNENIDLALALQKKQDESKIEEILKATELCGLGGVKVNRLSGGQKQRVAIARAIIKEPDILLCDEPTGSLDEETGDDIFALLKNFSKDRLVLVVSHDRDAANKFGDRVIELKSGAICCDKVISEAVEEPQNAEREKTCIKRGLSFKYAYKMAMPYLVARPFRFALCLVICFIIFSIVGIADIFISHDDYKTIAAVIQKLDIKYLAFDCDGEKCDDQIEQLKEMGRTDFSHEAEAFIYQDWNVGPFVKSDFFCDHCLKIDDSLLNDYNFKLLCGRLPVAEDEAVITAVTFRGLQLCGYKNSANGAVLPVNDYRDILYVGLNNPRITVHSIFNSKDMSRVSYDLKIVGILDTGFAYSNHFLDTDPYNDDDLTETLAYRSLHDFNMHNCMYVYKDLPIEEEAENVCVPISGNYGEILKKMHVSNNLWGNIGDDNTKGGLTFYNEASEITDNACQEIEFYSQVALYTAIGGFVLSVLFIFYLLSGTVADKKREIGVFRALGAKKADVIKIFAAENSVLGLSVLAFSCLLGGIAGLLINNYFVKEIGVKIAVLTFGFRQFAIIFAVLFAAIALGLLFPLIKVFRAKPVDLIAGRK